MKTAARVIPWAQLILLFNVTMYITIAFTLFILSQRVLVEHDAMLIWQLNRGEGAQDASRRRFVRQMMGFFWGAGGGGVAGSKPSIFISYPETEIETIKLRQESDKDVHGYPQLLTSTRSRRSAIGTSIR
jgi:hypothetical protein